jgi:hypothetical protein
MMSGDFAAFRTLWNAIPFTEASTQLICGCLNFYVVRSGKPLWVAERALALYKLKTETQKT